MDEILNIKELIDNNLDIKVIDGNISVYERELKNQLKYFDFEKPSVEYLERNIGKLVSERDLLIKSIIESTRTLINQLNDKHGDNYFIHYSKEDWFIQIHRSNCEEYRIWVNGSDLKSEKCKSFKDAKIKANSLNKDVVTDISDGCIECQPYLNLQSILRSI
jgi:hypothetical protein